MLIDYCYRGKRIRALEIGYYRVLVCCGEERHVVVHAPTEAPMLCGLTQSIATALADALSTYGPTADSDEHCPAVPQLMRDWVDMLASKGNGYAFQTFGDYCLETCGNRPPTRAFYPPDLEKMEQIKAEVRARWHL